jgi:hypothetical protein
MLCFQYTVGGLEIETLQKAMDIVREIIYFYNFFKNYLIITIHIKQFMQINTFQWFLQSPSATSDCNEFSMPKR